jgi:hypothetical protein
VFTIAIRAVQRVKAYQELGGDDLHVLLHQACLGSNLEVTPDELKALLSKDTFKMLIMVDGLDEYIGIGTLPVLDQLLASSTRENPPWHSGCGVLVTSRPTAALIDKVRQKSDRNYELIGFAPAQMREFVTKCLALNRHDGDGDGDGSTRSVRGRGIGGGASGGGSQPILRQVPSWVESSSADADDATKLLAVIDADVDLAAACQTAYTLAMVCAMYSQDPSMFDAGADAGGVNLTAIYREVVRLVAKGNVARRGLFDASADTMSDGDKALKSKLSKEAKAGMKGGLDRISRLALGVGFQAAAGAGATASGGFRTDFGQAEVEEIFGSGGFEVNSVTQLGLVTQIESDGGDDVEEEDEYENRYTFPHLTIQEFMAARAIVSGLVEGQSLLQCIEQHLDNPQWHVVLRFAVGLLSSGAVGGEGETDAARKARAVGAVKAIADRGKQPLRDWRGSDTGELTIKPRIFALCLQCVSESSGSGGSGSSNGAMLDAVKVLLMEKLDLAHCDITDVELGALAAVLPLVSGAEVHPTELCLTHSKCGIEGINRLCIALQDGRTTLTTINLGYNDIGNEGAKAVAEMLQVNATLTTINLGYNTIGYEGAKSLAEFLQSNATPRLILPTWFPTSASRRNIIFKKVNIKYGMDVADSVETRVGAVEEDVEAVKAQAVSTSMKLEKVASTATLAGSKADAVEKGLEVSTTLKNDVIGKLSGQFVVTCSIFCGFVALMRPTS